MSDGNQKSTELTGRLRWACPHCGEGLQEISAQRLRCPAQDIFFDRVQGIWRFLLPDRQNHFSRFIQEYQTVRQCEGRGLDDQEFYRQLPERDLSGRFSHEWRIRAISFRTLLKEVVLPAEREKGPVLQVLDLGAGNCWLSGRLAQRGHRVVAIDLLTNTQDGLGAFVHYGSEFIPVQADFDHLPFEEAQFDLAVLNASLHYSTDYRRTLGEMCRVLRKDGQVVILDSPIYQREDSGRQMVQEREERFEREYGFPSNALPSQGFLTFRLLQELGRDLGLSWRLCRPFYGLKWMLRPWKAWLARAREPARFALVVGTRPPP